MEKIDQKIINESCFLISTFDAREKFLDPFFYYYKKFIGSEFRIYLAKEEKEYRCKEGINIKQLNYNFPHTSKNLGYCNSWGSRLKSALGIIKNDGYKYVIFICDDGWIKSLSLDKFNTVIDKIEKYNADRIQLIGSSEGYILEPLDSEISLISPRSDVPWYLNHQASIWKIDSLDQLVLESDCATTSERDGSQRSKELKCRFLTFNEPVLDSIGVNHSSGGMYVWGQKMLRQFCVERNLNYEECSKKFKLNNDSEKKYFSFNDLVNLLRKIMPRRLYLLIRKVYNSIAR